MKAILMFSFKMPINYLVRALSYNQLLQPDRFNIKEVQAAIVKLLHNSSGRAEKVDDLGNCNTM